MNKMINKKIDVIFKLVKKNDEYFCHDSSTELPIKYDNLPLTDNTFSGWYPIGLLGVENKYYLIKYSINNEFVIWDLEKNNEDYSLNYVNHLFYSLKLYHDFPQIAEFIKQLTNPIGNFILNYSIPNTKFRNFLNLSQIIIHSSKYSDLDDSSLPFHIKNNELNLANLYIALNEVSNVYLNFPDVRGDAIPNVFKDIPQKIAYQKSIAKDNYFYIANIFGEGDLKVTRSLYLNPYVIAYYCTNGESSCFAFATGELGIITHLYLPDSSCVIFNNHPKNKIDDPKHLLELLCSGLFNNNFDTNFLMDSSKSELPVCLFTGMPYGNIYHLLVNDLGGIGRLNSNNQKISKVITSKYISMLGVNKEFLNNFLKIENSNIQYLDEIQDFAEINMGFMSMFLRENYYLSDIVRNNIIKHSFFRDEKMVHNIKKMSESGVKVILIGIRAGRRRWIDQVEGLSYVINELNLKMKKIFIVFDGTTSIDLVNENNDEHITAELEIVDNIRKRLYEVNSLSLIGKPAFLSVSVSSLCDFYIAPWGAGLSKYQIIGNKPGVIHTNQTVIGSFVDEYYSWERINMTQPIYVEPDVSVDYNEDRDDTPTDKRPNWKLFDNYQANKEDIIKMVGSL